MKNSHLFFSDSRTWGLHGSDFFPRGPAKTRALYHSQDLSEGPHKGYRDKMELTELSP